MSDIKVRHPHKQETRNQGSKGHVLRKGRQAPVAGKAGAGGSRTLLKCTPIKHTHKKDLLEKKDRRNPEGQDEVEKCC